MQAPVPESRSATSALASTNLAQAPDDQEAPTIVTPRNPDPVTRVRVAAATEETKEPPKKPNPLLGIVFPTVGETTVIMVQPSEERDLRTSPSEAKKLLQSDEMPGSHTMLKLARRISTAFDGKVYTLVSYDQRGDSRPDMGCVNISEFRNEVERNRRRGAYIVSTVGPPFGKQVEVVSVSVKGSFMQKIRKSA